MISLFLIICYFVVIFNILIPKIFEKLRHEEAAFGRLASAGSARRCVDGVAVSYALGGTGLVARVMTDANGLPLPCARAAEATTFSRCDGARGRGEFRELCVKAYAGVFL
ncbi:hypothetical protein [Equine parapoxvirus]|nr:hypothetical protein [Equine parapoxvirus]WOC35528.1 hypothetical protein [Equine parapoxvirus]